MKELNAIMEKLKIFENMYQSIRIIDPVKRKVLALNEGRLDDMKEALCYDYWKNSKVCENCISIRAYNENDTIYKLERKANEIFLVTAVPVTYKGNKVVVEMLKNATNNLFFSDGNLKKDEEKAISTFESLNQAAIKDVLTNLYNRRYINEKLPSEILASSLKNIPLSVIFADLDYFKNINDTYGHRVGDKVLREFAKELKIHTGNGDNWAARYGGEEFLICLPGSNNQEATEFAERFRLCVMRKEFKVDNRIIHITCSFGVHTIFNQTDSITQEHIIEQLDKKLYEAKNTGRNKVV